MARKKEYIEDKVIEKAMQLFWRNGYETTSMKMLEQEMGINKFSIYSSFGSKNGVFLESIKCYKKKLSNILDKLENSNNGLKGIEQYFYDFLEFSKENNIVKGCLVTTTAVELGRDADPKIKNQLHLFTEHVKGLFMNNLKQEKTITKQELEEKGDYLIISIFGLASASKAFGKKQLDTFIKNIFNNI